MKKPIVLTIIDGLGISRKEEGNAYALAKKPCLETLFKSFPYMEIEAAGEAVGLPHGQMGNSEVGHLNIGAGKVVYTGLSLITQAIRDGSFYENHAFLNSIKHAQDNNGTVHVMGLLSQGGVHSIQNHLFHILDLLNQKGVKNVMVHIFGDGRDVAPKSIEADIKKLYEYTSKYDYKIASICGRIFAMDRDEKFDKTEEAFQMLLGNASNSFNGYRDLHAYVQGQYSKNITDEFIQCAINKEEGVKFLKDNDSVIFFNFRPDRARQLSHLLVGSELYGYLSSSKLKNIHLTTMMKYEGITKCEVAFDSMIISNPLGKVVANAGLKQLRIAETQKYAHVTFFMDGGNDIELKNADRILIPSLKNDNFAEVPQMSAKEITDALIEKLGDYDLVIMNYANPDMVGHTGDLKAAIKAVEFLDQQITRLYSEVTKLGGTLVITADHGNCEIMLDEKGEPATKHTSSLVPLCITKKGLQLFPHGSLANIAPTILDLLGLVKPKEMDKDSLIFKQ